MLTAAALVTGAPVVVPSLSGPAAVDVVELRTATLEVARRLADTAQHWVAVGVGEPQSAPARQGSFAGFGVDERVYLDPETDGTAVDDTLSTPMLIAGWIRGQVAPEACVRPILVSASTSPSRCQEIGAELGARIAASDTAVGLLVVADGSFALTAGAPGGAIDGARDEQTRIDAAVALGDLETLAALDLQTCVELRIDGRAAWQVAAAVWSAATGTTATTPRPRVAESLYCAAPFGVGYQVAWWGR